MLGERRKLSNFKQSGKFIKILCGSSDSETQIGKARQLLFFRAVTGTSSVRSLNHLRPGRKKPLSRPVFASIPVTSSITVSGSLHGVILLYENGFTR
jgi:hypothetical protein